MYVMFAIQVKPINTQFGNYQFIYKKLVFTIIELKKKEISIFNCKV